jgi:hypothetical protein
LEFSVFKPAFAAALYNVPMSLMPVTRRQAALLLAASPVIAQVTSTVPPQGSPAPASAPATPQERLAKAYADVRKISDRLAGIEAPISLEPAFSFRA